MMQCTTITKWNAHHVTLCTFGSFANCLRHLARFTCTKASAAFAITNYDKGGKAKTATTFYNFCYAVDTNQKCLKSWLVSTA